MTIPLLDLARQYNDIKEETDVAVFRALSKASYIMGENVVAFEHEFANYVGVRHAISVGTGTDALVITLKAFGIGNYYSLYLFRNSRSYFSGWGNTSVCGCAVRYF